MTDLRGHVLIDAEKNLSCLLFFFEELIWDQVDSNFLSPQERIDTGAGTDPGPVTKVSTDSPSCEVG